MFIVFLGADGSGKSSVINELQTLLDNSFFEVYVYHLHFPLPWLSNHNKHSTSLPHQATPYNPLLSFAKLFYLLAVYNIGFYLHYFKTRSKNILIILDRYYHDLLIDPKRFRYGGPLWLVRIMGYMIPKPTLFFLLRAPATTLQSRKQEVTLQETSRQVYAYDSLFKELSNGIVLDAEQPLSHIASLAQHHILKSRDLLC